MINLKNQEDNIYIGIEKIDDVSHLINMRGDISRIYKMSFPAVLSLTVSDIQKIQSVTADAIATLPIDIGLQKMDLITKGKNNYIPKSASLSELNDANFYNTRIATKIDFYFIFTLLAEPTKARTYNNSLSRYLYNIYESQTKGLFEYPNYNIDKLVVFDNAIKTFFETFKSAFAQHHNFGVRELNENEIKQLIQTKYFNADLSSLDNNSVHNLVDKGTHLDVGTKHIETYNIAPDGLPSHLYDFIQDKNFKPKNSLLPTAMLHDLYFSSSADIIINSYFWNIDNDKIINKIESKRNIAQRLSYVSRNNKFLYEQLERFLNHITKHKDEKIIKFHQSYSLISDRNEPFEQQRIRRYIQTKLEKSYKFKLDTNNDIQLLKYLSYSPGNMSDIADDDKIIITNKNVTKLLNFEGSSPSATKGLPLLDRKTKQQIYVDLFVSSNMNFAIIGPSGSGKGFSANHIIRDLLEKKSMVIIGDVGYSYQKLCEEYKGTYIETSETNPLKINPFKVFKYDSDKQEYIIDQEAKEDELVFVINLLMVCWKGTDNVLPTNSETTYINYLIQDYIKIVNKEKREPNYTDFYNTIERIVKENSSNIYDVDKETFSLKEFLLNMKMFCKGERYGHIFDIDNNSTIADNNFVVFEFQKLLDNKQLFTITYYILTNMVKLKLLKRPDNTDLVFLLDELHVLMNGEYGNTAPFIVYCAKTVRKWGGIFGMATQDIADFLDNEDLTSSIILNVPLWIFKKQADESRDIIQKTLNLSNLQTDIIYSISDPYKELILYFKDFESLQAYQIEVSEYNYWLYTTNKKDKDRLKQEREKIGLDKPIGVAIKNIINQTKNP